jgi:hypothetical protein
MQKLLIGWAIGALIVLIILIIVAQIPLII